MTESSYHISNLTPRCGSLISGLDLSKELTNRQFDEIQQALIDRTVVVFRDQNLTESQHIAIANKFGKPQDSSRAAFGKLPDYPEIDVLESSEAQPPHGTRDLWHTDFAGTEKPSMGTLLYARDIPSEGGDTIWVNTIAAYEALSDRMKTHIDGLHAYHDNFQPYSEHANPGLWEGENFEYNKKIREIYRPPLHPVVRSHPVTGKKGLFVNESMTTFIDGIDRRESDFILRFLFDHIRAPEFQYRHNWKINDLIIWDNRLSVHYALFDYKEHRLMHRIVLEGDKPI